MYLEGCILTYEAFTTTLQNTQHQYLPEPSLFNNAKDVDSGMGD